MEQLFSSAALWFCFYCAQYSMGRLQKRLHFAEGRAEFRKFHVLLSDFALDSGRNSLYAKREQKFDRDYSNRPSVHQKGGRRNEKTNLYRHRPQIVLRLRGVPRARARPARHPSRRGRREAHGQNHLSCRDALAQKLRHFRPQPSVRGAAARPRGKRRPAQPRPGARPDR